MMFIIYLFFLINIFSYTTNALPYRRYRRQIISGTREDLPYGGWGGGSNNPSGGSPGAYYGSGLNPNDGIIGPPANDAHNSVNVLNYNQGYNSNWNQQQYQQPSQYGTNNNYNNMGQSSNMNNYYNRPYNRYPPGSQGWYATGGNYWYNKGQSSIPNAWLSILSLLILIICI